MGRHSKVEEIQEPQTQESLTVEQAIKQTIGTLEKTLAEQTVALRELHRDREKTKLELEAANRAKFDETVRKQNLLKTFLPTLLDKATLDERKIEILFTNQYSKSKRRGAKPIVSPGLDVARSLKSIFNDIDVTAAVTARLWGISSGSMQAVDLDAENTGKKVSPNLNFDVPAEYIMQQSGVEKEKGKNYIVITDGRIYGGDITTLALKLAFLERNPKATLDFVVCSDAERTHIDTLVKRLKTKLAGDRVNIVKVRTEGEVLSAVQSVIKGHVIENLPAKPVEAPAPVKPSFGRRFMHKMLHGQAPMKP